MQKDHHDIITTIQDAFHQNMFTEFIEELMVTTYLGPAPEELTTSLYLSSQEDSTETSTNDILFPISCMILSVFGLCIIFVILTMARRKLWSSMCGDVGVTSSLKMGRKKLAIHNKVGSMFNRRRTCIHSLLLTSDASVKGERVEAEEQDNDTNDGDTVTDSQPSIHS